MMKSKFRVHLIGPLAVCVAGFLAAAAAAQTPVPASGNISVIAKQMNVPIEGRFRTFSAQIEFDPARPTAAKVMIDVDVASLDFGDDDFNYELRTRTWLDARGYPKATFASQAVRPLAADRLAVSGTLNIKGKALHVTVPVTFKTEGAKRVFEGELQIRRTIFNVGEGEWRDTSVVADDVVIRFRLITEVK